MVQERKLQLLIPEIICLLQMVGTFPVLENQLYTLFCSE